MVAAVSEFFCGSFDFPDAVVFDKLGHPNLSPKTRNSGVVVKLITVGFALHA